MAFLPASLFSVSDGFKVGPIPFDLELTESHSLNSTVTTHKVEQGSEIADHIQKQLRNGQVVGLVSNYSLNAPPILGAGLQELIGITAENRALDAYRKFMELWDNRELVTIVTSLQVYEDVAITNVSCDRTPESGEALEFRVAFQQLDLVLLQKIELTENIKVLEMTTDSTVDKDIEKVKLNRQASPKANVGRVTPPPVTEPVDLGVVPPPGVSGGSF